MDDTHHDPPPEPDEDLEDIESVDPAEAPPLAERIAERLQHELDADEGRSH